MSEGWWPQAVKRPGPAWKVGYSYQGEHGLKRGEVKHSAEGYWPGIYAQLDGPLPAGSWHFTIGYDRVEQHYDYRAHCWHAGDTDDDGGVAANIDLVGIEHLGRVGEDLSPFQIDKTVELSIWLMEQAGYERAARYPQQTGLWTLAEHNQVSDIYTPCPSGRIPWAVVLERIDEHMALADDVKALKEEIARLKKKDAAIDGAIQYQGKLIGGAYDAIKMHSEIIVDQEGRITALEEPGH